MMKSNLTKMVLAAALLAGVKPLLHAQGTAITYQGRLNSGGSPAAGSYDLAFKVYDTEATAGTLLAGPTTNAAVAVSNGLFTVTLDFGAGLFTGNARWLEIAVRTNGGGSFIALAPRHLLTPAPYAIFASSASNLLGSVATAQLTGAIPSAQLPANVVTNTETALTLGGSFSGNGNSLTNLNASQLTSGIVPASVLSGFLPPYYAFIGGGQFNTANNTYAVVGGGANNNASYLAAVGGGHANNASGYYSTVPGGENNQAGGQYSFAAGQNASALHLGAFVWADSQGIPFPSTANDQFLIRAQGGVGIGTNVTSGNALTVAGNVAATSFSGNGANVTNVNAGTLSGTLSPASIGAGTITGTMLAPGAVSSLGAPDGSPTNALQVDNNGLVGIGTSTPTAGLQITSGASITTLPVVFQVANGQYGWDNLNYPYTTALNGSLMAVGAFNGLTIANFTNTSYPVVLSQVFHSSSGYANLRNVMGLAWAGSNLVAGAYGYAPVNPSSVFIISFTNPASPVKLSEVSQGVGGWDYLEGIRSVAVSGNLLAVGVSDSNAVTLADISNPSAPVLKSAMVNGVSGFTNLNWVNSVALSHNLLAIGASSSSAVTLVDVSNPASPVKLVELVNGVGSFTNLAGVAGVAFSETGNLLAIAASGSSVVTLVDVSNPASPVKLAELCDGVGGYYLNGVSSLAFSGNRLAIDNGEAWSGEFAVTVVDVSNPARPVLLATAIDGLSGADFLWQPTGISIAGTNVVLGGTSSAYHYGLSIFGLGTETVGLESAGWVGIGTTRPTAALDVVGNVVVEKATLFGVDAQRVAFGQHAGASGFGSLAAGYFANASGNDSIALGFFSAASGGASTAIGEYARANGGDSTALGAFVTASGTYSTAMGNQADAIHDNTFVWSDGSMAWPNFSSTTSNEFSICAQNGVHIQSDKGIHLHATNAPMIVRDLDLFASYAPSPKAGVGRWGMFMEPNTLVMGIPGDDTTGRSFQVAKYNLHGSPTMLMQVDQTGNLTAAGNLTASGSISAGVFAGNGSFLTSVNASSLGGLGAASFAPATGSTNYIQNQTASPQPASFNISGGITASNAHFSGLMRSGSETGTAQAPNPAGLVVRRINSTINSSNSIVALVRIGSGANITLVRDGTAGGFQIQYPASPGFLTIACVGIATNGVTRNFYVGKANPGTAGTVQIYTDAQAIAHFECTFGDTFYAGDHLTRVTLSRFCSGTTLDSFWSGDLVSTYNQ